MAVDMAQAEQYFSSRLNADAWVNAGDIDKQKAVATAERQIDTLRLSKDIDAVNKNYAIYEQTLFLLSLSDYDRERQRTHVLGVIGGSIGDAGEYSSAEIVRQKMCSITICPEAMSLLNPYVLPTKIRMGGLR